MKYMSRKEIVIIYGGIAIKKVKAIVYVYSFQLDLLKIT